MKKLLAVLLAVLFMLSMVACSTPADEPVVDEPATEEPADSAYVAENNTSFTDEQIAALAAAYNEVAPIYNEVYVTAEANGWLEDELTATEVNAVAATLGSVGQALTEDLSVLEGADIDALIELLPTFGPALEEMLERVSVPYEG